MKRPVTEAADQYHTLRRAGLCVRCKADAKGAHCTRCAKVINAAKRARRAVTKPAPYPPAKVARVTEWIDGEIVRLLARCTDDDDRARLRAAHDALRGQGR